MIKAVTIGLAGVLLIAGCGKSFDTVLSERHGEAEPKLKQIEQVGRGALTYQEELKDIALPEGEKLRFGDAPNAVLVQAELFESAPEKRRPRLDLILDTSWLTETRKALSDAPEKFDGAYLERLFDTLAAIKFLVVIRTRLLAEPAAAGGGLFSPGLWQGEVMVFEVASGDFLGGAPLSVSNSDEVDVNAEDPGKWLHSDLWSNTRASVSAALQGHTEGAILS
ncbi:MAG: hypothetical protein K8I27_02535 [Planctomycetes bacterium]|nr:hypothetical protein [Planctomycetota bacterium]